jgi:hypothetical protein
MADMLSYYNLQKSTETKLHIFQRSIKMHSFRTVSLVALASPLSYESSRLLRHVVISDCKKLESTKFWRLLTVQELSYLVKISELIQKLKGETHKHIHMSSQNSDLIIIIFYLEKEIWANNVS